MVSKPSDHVFSDAPDVQGQPGFAVASKQRFASTSRGRVSLLGVDAIPPKIHQGAIKINVDGVVKEYWLPGATTIDDNTTVKYEPPWRYYLTNHYTTDYSKVENFYQPELIGKTFSVDMFFGPDGAGCGCNLNFYLVDMPASTAGNDEDWYCDAQCFDGLGCCHEFDMYEGNAMVSQITNHACSGKGKYQGHSDWACHKWGDPADKTKAAEFSPGPEHTIDTTRKFTYEQEFWEVNGQAIVTTRMVQGSKRLEKTLGPHNQELNDMFKVIKAGMVFVTGYWYNKAMNWLDGEACGTGDEQCNQKPVYISNWKITSNRGPAPIVGPPSTPGKCCWGKCDGCTTGLSGWCSEAAGNCAVCDGTLWCIAK